MTVAIEMAPDADEAMPGTAATIAAKLRCQALPRIAFDVASAGDIAARFEEMPDPFLAPTPRTARGAKPAIQSACGTTAVTSISTFARSSISALTSTALIATS